MAHFREGLTFCELDQTYKAPVTPLKESYGCEFPPDLPLEQGIHSFTLVGGLSSHEIEVIAPAFYSTS